MRRVLNPVNSSPPAAVAARIRREIGFDARHGLVGDQALHDHATGGADGRLDLFDARVGPNLRNVHVGKR